MKKFITIVLLICTLIGTLALCLTSCETSNNNNNNHNTNNENTYTPPPKTADQEVEDLISSIKDADSCYKAAKAFFALTKNEQKQVYNSSTLKNHMKTYSNDTRIRDYLMEDSAAEQSKNFHNRLKNKLLNVNSYTVNNQTTVVFYDNATNNYYLYIKIDYSAQNKAGGYNRYENNADYYVWKDTYWSTLPYSTAEDRDLVTNIYSWEFDEYTRYSFTYIYE